MIRNVKISEITINEGRRDLDENGVKNLMESINNLDLINPITVNNAKELLAGRHRLEACKRLGWTEIPCNFIEGNYIEYALAEIDENLIRTDLNVLERAKLLDKRKFYYEERYPETKKGTAGGVASGVARNRTTTESVIVRPESFVDNTSKLTNQSPSKIREEIAIANNLTEEVKELIQNEPIADKKTELLKLSKLEPEKQIEVAQKIAKQEIKKVDDVLVKEPINDGLKNELSDLKNDLLNALLIYEKSPFPLVREKVKHLKNYINHLGG